MLRPALRASSRLSSTSSAPTRPRVSHTRPGRYGTRRRRRAGVIAVVFFGAVPMRSAARVSAALVLLATLLTTPSGGANGEAVAPLVHTLAPAPGSVTGVGETLLRASVASPATVTAVRLTVDGLGVVAVELAPRDASGQVVVSGSAVLSAGEHVARVTVEDSAGGRAERAWSFLSTARSTRRLAGGDRFETAAAISAVAFPRHAEAAVVVRADDFPDALAGAPLATSVRGPLLLAGRDGLPVATATELQRVLAAGSTVHLLGGLAALGEGVADDVAALGLRTVRHAGADRFATAAAVARALPPSPQAIVASGESFPDALAASAPAARDGVPVLLTAGGSLPDVTAEALSGRGVEQVTLVGGSAAIGEGVERRVRELVARVARVSGPDRYATAVALREAFYVRTGGVSLASGEAFPDALAGAVLSAARAEPLLLTPAGVVASATGDALRTQQPHEITVYGGAAAVGDDVVRSALRAAVDGPDAPRVVATRPAALVTVPDLDAVTVTLDRPADAARSSVYVEVGGVELPGAIEQAGPTTTLTLPVDASRSGGGVHVGRVVIAAAGVDGAMAHDEFAFTYAPFDPVFATVDAVALHLPSPVVEMVGYHQSNHDGARQLVPRETATASMTLPDRGRGTGSRTAADVVAAPDQPVLATVTGRVLRAGSYVLYCDYTDHYLVVEPDARPGWEVKVLHFEGLRVAAGDRVVASETVVGSAPRSLPFRSQVDDYSTRGWPHLHIEVVDPSIPDRPGRGC